MNKTEIELAIKNGVADKVYPNLVQELINEKYSVFDEIAILRQRNSKKAEFNAYNNYCEECKAKAKELLQLNKEEEEKENV